MVSMKKTIPLVFFFVGFCIPPAVIADSVAEAISTEVRKIFETHRDAIVKIRARDQFGIRIGSGFFIDPVGTIYTHAGVVFKADEVTVLQGGHELPARVLLVDERSGIALLKVEASTPFILIGD